MKKLKKKHKSEEEAPTKKKKASGFNKPMEISDELAALVGGKPKPRSKVVKKLWLYIKNHDLQDKKNGRILNPDKKFAKVFGKDPINMFAMNKKLGKHLS